MQKSLTLADAALAQVYVIFFKPLIALTAAAMVAIFPGTFAFAQSLPSPVHIADYRSPSGQYVLTVDPSQIYGQGKGSYRMLQSGKEIWSKELDFTLYDAVVNNAGEVAGYAYTNGYEGFPISQSNRSRGALVIAILHADGNVRLDKRIARTETRVIHGSPNPTVRGIFVDPANDRLVVRIDDDTDRQSRQFVERWLIFGFSAGDVRPTYVLRAPPNAGHSIYSPFRIGPAGTVGLTLVAWRRIGDKPGGHHGVRLSLLDSGGCEVWNQEWHDEFKGEPESQRWQYAYDELFPRNDLKTNEFAYRSNSEQATLKFAATQLPSRKWTVATVLRTPTAVSLQAPSKARALHATSVVLNPKGVIGLGGDSGLDSPALGIRKFEFDDAGRIGFVSQASGHSYYFTLFEPTGKLSARVALPVEMDGAACPDAAWIGGDRWVIVQSGCGRDGKARAWVLDAKSSSVSPVDGFSGARFSSGNNVAGSGMKGFAILGDFDSNEVTIYDGTGSVLWAVKKPAFSPQSVAMRSNGEIGVLSGISDEIVVLSADGKPLRTIKLEKTLGTKLNYVSGLSTDIDGGWILHDFQGKPPIYLLDSSGKLKSKFVPHYADGRTFAIHGNVRRAPDGRLWTSDKAALLRMDGAGKVDFIIGRDPNATSIGEIAALTMDAEGRFFVADKRNGWIHVLDNNGKKVRILKPDAGDFPIGEYSGNDFLAVSGDGSVYRRIESRESGGRHSFLKFDASGARVGLQPSNGNDVRETWHFKKGSTEKLVLGYQAAYLYDLPGNRVAIIDRRADRLWLDSLGVADIARDGTFAIVANPSNDTKVSASVTFFTAKGKAVRTVDLPGMRFPRLAFNGNSAFIVEGSTLFIIDAKDGNVGGFQIPGTQKNVWWRPFSSPDEKEIWLLNGEEKVVYRYAAPSFQ